MRFSFTLLLGITLSFGGVAQIQTGADQLDSYLPLLKNKKVGLIVNPTSEINNTHLVDTLSSLNVDIKRVFGPEHGFRGNVSAGAHVSNEKTDAYEIISLYGKNKKPTKEQLSDLDIVIFDIQDVGVRFYTYISTLHYVMEACAENHKELIILDRPNPNGNYIDGPVLNPKFKSFVGMHSIPVVHGLTIGEIAQMINGENWISSPCEITIINCLNYNHNTSYNLPVKPSPNLPNIQSIKLYPSLCFFEPTQISVGRGTESPFQVVGSPLSKGEYTFTPKSIPGVSKYPKHENKECKGLDLRTSNTKEQIDLSYLIQYYSDYPNKAEFFTKPSFFNLLAGNDQLIKQIKEGWSEEKIRNSWQEGLNKYKVMRKKYLLYADFE